MNIISLIKRFEKLVRQAPEGAIHVNLRDINQLFNSMDPSPFNEKDLDEDAEMFIESWALEYQVSAPLTLIIHLEQTPPQEKAEKFLRASIHNFYAHKADLTDREFKQLMREGRVCLLIGLFFLSSCMLANELLAKSGESTFMDLARESLLVAGWVAMWRPIQIYLYEWWPILRKARIYTKMSRMEVKVRVKP